MLDAVGFLLPCTAIITGSTSGIGLGIARALAEAGCHVMLNGIGDAASIERERRKIIDEFAVGACFNGADLSKAAEVSGLIETATRELGHVDILVNNAGIQFAAPLEEFPPERWEAVLAINLSATFYAIRAVLPQMRKRNWGRIVNIAPAHGLVASVQKAAYVASKHAVLGLTRVTALETARTGVTCNAICPGWVKTPLVEKQIADRAARDGISIEEATTEPLAEKQPRSSSPRPNRSAPLRHSYVPKPPPRSEARRFLSMAVGRCNEDRIARALRQRDSGWREPHDRWLHGRWHARSFDR